MDIGTLAMDIWNQYMQLQKTQPVIGSILTSAVTFTASDIVSQLMIDKKVNWKKVRYTASLTPLYGVSMYLVMQSGELVGKYLSTNPFLKSALGPNLWGNIYTSYFFVNNTVGEKSDYSFIALLKNYASIFQDYSGTFKERLHSFKNKFKKHYLDNILWTKYKPALIGTLTVWNVIQTLNYFVFNEEMRTPVALAAGFFWTIYLSEKSLIGGREITKKTGLTHTKDSYLSS
ncbi:MAG: Mpv17/PMP22 family protein [Candidatus Woesearchaeota archaeon]